MAERSIRFRTTLGATVVVAVTLILGGALMVFALRSSLTAAAEERAENRAESLADEINRTGAPSSLGTSTEDDPASVIVQLATPAGDVVDSSGDRETTLPLRDADDFRIPDDDHAFLVRTEDSDGYVISAAASLEEVDDATEAIVPILGLGLPVLLLIVALTTFLVTRRALAPVDEIRARLDQIVDDSMDQRVPVPGSKDEISRLAITMNGMLERLDSARLKQRRFVSDASHELRTPLAAMRQTAEVAIAHPGAFSEGELAQEVLADAIRMQALVEQLLTLSRMEPGVSVAVQQVDFSDVVLTEAHRRPPDCRINVEADDVDDAQVSGHALALSQLVANLVTNARRHARSRVRVSLSTADGEALLRVEDDGNGVADVDRERIFDRFVRLDESRARDDGGSGLGLALVREIAQAHGGRATCTTSPLGGAQFEVRIPHI